MPPILTTKKKGHGRSAPSSSSNTGRNINSGSSNGDDDGGGSANRRSSLDGFDRGGSRDRPRSNTTRNTPPRKFTRDRRHLDADGDPDRDTSHSANDGASGIPLSQDPPCDAENPPTSYLSLIHI